MITLKWKWKEDKDDSFQSIFYPEIFPYDYTKHQIKVSKLFAIVSVLKW